MRNVPLREIATSIWHAGVAAVDPYRLVAEQVYLDGGDVCIGPAAISLRGSGKIEVLGAGKAGSAMAAGLESALFAIGFPKHRLSGFMNVPAGNATAVERITLFEARPAGRNEPTELAWQGTQEILRRAKGLRSEDVCVCLISGGGSALLPAPIEGVTLAEKIAVTRLLSAAGANIVELNTVRRALSQIKGGGLARQCGAGQLVSLIMSDVLGDPLEIIASGPTVPVAASPEMALQVLRKFDLEKLSPPSIERVLTQRFATPTASPCNPHQQLFHEVIGNNAVAVDAAGVRADELGLKPAMTSAITSEGDAVELGRHFARLAIDMLRNTGPDCLISGGEPTVNLAAEPMRGLGGRNQQLVLATMIEWLGRSELSTGELDRLLLLSAGTDGEDGPTDAAGGFADGEFAKCLGSDVRRAQQHLDRSNAYPLLQACNALLITGPTGTNVCDLRVLIVDKR